MVKEITLSVNEIISICKRVIKLPTHSMKKGSMGRICIIGGTESYTGAPYFSAISALRAGCDLAYVFCTKEAAVPIKSYSPDIIVIPSLNPDFLENFEHYLNLVDSFVIGPGLGRSDDMIITINSLITRINDFNKTCVLDADALWYITKNSVGLPNLKNSILTPNFRELQNLSKYLNLSGSKPSDICARLNCACIFAKGKSDAVANEQSCYTNDHYGVPRRVGGQGDILSGLIAAFVHFIRMDKVPDIETIPAHIEACIAASHILRAAAHQAYFKNPIGFLTSEIVEHISFAVKNTIM